MTAALLDLRADPFASVMGGRRGLDHRPTSLHPHTDAVLAAVAADSHLRARRLVNKHKVTDVRALAPVCDQLAGEALEAKYGNRVRSMLGRAGVLPALAADVCHSRWDKTGHIHIWPHGRTPTNEYWHQRTETTPCGLSPADPDINLCPSLRGAWQSLKADHFKDTSYSHCPTCAEYADEFDGTRAVWEHPVFDDPRMNQARSDLAGRLEGEALRRQKLPSKTQAQQLADMAASHITISVARWAASGDDQAWRRALSVGQPGRTYGLSDYHLGEDLPEGVIPTNALVPIERWRDIFGQVPLARQHDISVEDLNDFRRSLWQATLEAAHGRPWEEHIGVVFAHRGR